MAAGIVMQRGSSPAYMNPRDLPQNHTQPRDFMQPPDRKPSALGEVPLHLGADCAAETNNAGRTGCLLLFSVCFEHGQRAVLFYHSSEDSKREKSKRRPAMDPQQTTAVVFGETRNQNSTTSRTGAGRWRQPFSETSPQPEPGRQMCPCAQARAQMRVMTLFPHADFAPTES